MSAQNVGGVSIRSRNGAPSRKECVVNGHMTQGKQSITPPPPRALTFERESIDDEN